MKPIKNRITIKRDKKEEGLIITPGNKDKNQGVIIEVGPDQKLGLKKGDRVLFGPNIGCKIESNGENLLVMNDSDVLAVIG